MGWRRASPWSTPRNYTQQLVVNERDNARRRAMPRYYFHVVDGHTLKDNMGVELENDDRARQEGARAAELTRPMFKGKSFRVVVKDEMERVVVELVVNGSS